MNWFPNFNDPITRLGFMNFFTMAILTLYRGYLPIFLTNDVIVSVIIFTVIVSSINFFQIFMRIPLGNLSQILGRRPLILLGNLSIDFAMILLFTATNYITVFISALLVAIGMSAHWPATFSYIQDINPSGYGRNNGRIFKLGDLGILTGSLVAKIFLDQLLLQLRMFFLLLAIVGSIAVCVFYFLLPESLDSDHRQHSTPREFINENFVRMITKFKEITFYPGMAKIYSFQIVLSFSEFFFAVFFPLLVQKNGFSQGTIGEIIFYSTFFLLWLKPYLGGVSDKLGYRLPVLGALVIIASLYIIAPLLKTLVLLVLLYFIVLSLLFIGYPAVNSAAASTSPIKQRGLALGTLGVFTSLGRSSSTIVMSPVWEVFDIYDTFMVAGLVILLLALILYFISRKGSKTGNIKILNESEIAPKLT